MPLTCSHRDSHAIQGSSLSMSEELKARRWGSRKALEATHTHTHTHTHTYTHTHVHVHTPHKMRVRDMSKVITQTVVGQEVKGFMSIVRVKQEREAS